MRPPSFKHRSFVAGALLGTLVASAAGCRSEKRAPSAARTYHLIETGIKAPPVEKAGIRVDLEARMRLDLTREAALSFGRCVELRPEQAAARAWLGFALERLGDREKAVAAYRASLSLDPTNPYARRGLERLTGAPPSPRPSRSPRGAP